MNESLAATNWRGHAFGVTVRASEELITLSACTDNSHSGGATWSRTSKRAALGRWWRPRGVQRLVDRRFDDGRSMMSIDVDSAGAYLVEAPGYGVHHVSSDGLQITSVLAPDAPWNWQRLFVAQVLPLAASIHGLEILHASAVSVDGRAVALSAPSRTGKTSIALHLVARGATLLTDDVLAVDTSGAIPRAHHGARLLSAAPEELSAVFEGRARLGSVLGENGKVYLRPPLEPGHLPLAAIYRLVRRGKGHPFRVVEDSPPSPAGVLGAAFLTYENNPNRLRRHLDAASHLARSVPFYVVELSPHLSAAQAAEALEAHILESLAT